MTLRPPTHREPTDEDMQCLPEGTLYLDDITGWGKSSFTGKKIAVSKRRYAVPITKQEEAPTLHEPITREALNKALRERDEARAEARESLRDKFAMAALSGLVFHNDWGMGSDAEIANGAYCFADAMLAARNNQPEKV